MFFIERLSKPEGKRTRAYSHAGLNCRYNRKLVKLVFLNNERAKTSCECDCSTLPALEKLEHVSKIGSASNPALRLEGGKLLNFSHGDGAAAVDGRYAGKADVA
jgi:hypothetical protein